MLFPPIQYRIDEPRHSTEGQRSISNELEARHQLGCKAAARVTLEEPTKSDYADNGAMDPDNYVGVMTTVGRVKPVDLSSCVLDSLLQTAQAF